MPNRTERAKLEFWNDLRCSDMKVTSKTDSNNSWLSIVDSTKAVGVKKMQNGNINKIQNKNLHEIKYVSICIKPRVQPDQTCFKKEFSVFAERV